MKQIKLSNSIAIPQIGLGTWQITDKEMMEALLGNAYQAGYRLIDTAAAYSNEMAIGQALQKLGIARKEWILSDKVWNTYRGYDNVRKACEKSLKKLKTDYLDLYLIHWPASPKLYPDWTAINADTWRGMESLYQEGKVRAIGVCNFKAHHLMELQKTAEIMPMVNQLEAHPGMT
ncbi:MAG: aldo/keto reductase, partial [Lachnospiraceae bacterium]|nr:aldo/keto reductase [Lachnospiraceae bacterium]